MKLSTTVNKKDSAVRNSVDVVSAATFYGQTSKDLHEKLRTLVVAMGKAPEWAKEYVRGYQDCLVKALHLTVLIHGGYIDGKFVSTFKQRADYYEKLGFGAKEFNDRATNKGIYWEEYFSGRNNIMLRGVRPYICGIPRARRTTVY